jgi:hypothetical protein
MIIDALQDTADNGCRDRCLPKDKRAIVRARGICFVGLAGTVAAAASRAVGLTGTAILTGLTDLITAYGSSRTILGAIGAVFSWLARAVAADRTLAAAVLRTARGCFSRAAASIPTSRIAITAAITRVFTDFTGAIAAGGRVGFKKRSRDIGANNKKNSNDIFFRCAHLQ